MNNAESAQWKVETRIAQTADEMQMVWVVRGAVFLAESVHSDIATYADECQANDIGATHILALVNGDPAGIIRLRRFADFAMLERIGVRKRYRTYTLFKALAKAGVDLARTLGYRTIVGRAHGETGKLWVRMIRAVPSGPHIEFERGVLTPMIAHFPAMADSLSNLPFGHPLVEELITQREGYWDFSYLQRARNSAA